MLVPAPPLVGAYTAAMLIMRLMDRNMTSIGLPANANKAAALGNLAMPLATAVWNFMGLEDYFDYKDTLRTVVLSYMSVPQGSWGDLGTGAEEDDSEEGQPTPEKKRKAPADSLADFSSGDEESEGEEKRLRAAGGRGGGGKRGGGKVSAKGAKGGKGNKK